MRKSRWNKLPEYIDRVEQPREVKEEIEDVSKYLKQFGRGEKSGVIADKIDNKKTHDLDIIIPMYNVEKYIGKCIDSVINQNTKYDIRVICVDDGSPDRCGEIAEAFRLKDSRVKVIHQENKGLSGARNTGLKILDAKYVLFLDSDDYLCEGAIDFLLDTAFSNSSDVVQGGYITVDLDDNRLNTYTQKEQAEANRNNLSGFVWGKVWKADVFDGIQFPEGFWFEDAITWMILMRRCYGINVISDLVYSYRINPKGITATSYCDEKVVDTILVIDRIMQDVMLSDVNWTEEDYYSLLYHLKISAVRINRQSKQMRKMVFVYCVLFLKKYFRDFSTTDDNLILFEKSLREGKFLLYQAAAELI